jgi:stage III sporulation protein SpoIIIAA
MTTITDDCSDRFWPELQRRRKVAESRLPDYRLSLFTFAFPPHPMILDPSADISLDHDDELGQAEEQAAPETSALTKPNSSGPEFLSEPITRQVFNDLDELMSILPPEIEAILNAHPDRLRLVEVILDLGRRPEARFPDRAEYLADTLVSREDLAYAVDRVGIFSGDNRAGIESTLHRISAMRNRSGEVIGLTCRVGRAVFGTIGLIRDLVETGQSILMLGRPGVGKTTALREIARILADDLNKRVVIIDSSNEIAGDGDIPHPAIGRARRMQVSRPELQHQVMIEAVENHMPEVIIIDEIGTELEAQAARTIAERGVQLVGTAHGNQIENLIKNPTLSDLVGGIQSVTLGDDEARRRGSQKTVLERKAPPTFEIAVEMLERERWVIHASVATTVDSLLRGRKPNPEIRSVGSSGQIVVSHEFPDQPIATPPKRPTNITSFESSKSGKGWRSSGAMQPLPLTPNFSGNLGRSSRSSRAEPPEQTIAQRLNDSFPNGYSAPPQPNPGGYVTGNAAYGNAQGAYEPAYADLDYDGYDKSDAADLTNAAFTRDGKDLPLYVYPYAISNHQLDQVIENMHLPVILTKDISSADVVLALRTHMKNTSKLRQIARNHHVPVHTIKSNTLPQIIRALQRLLNMEDMSSPEEVDLQLFTQRGSDDELEALEEARLAVEQIVIAKGQPVELLPRSAPVRKMQHELVEHYRLKSVSFGDDPNRRLRIYPA